MSEFREKLEQLCDGIDPKWDKDKIIFYLVMSITGIKAPELREIFDIAGEKGNKEGR